MRRIALVLLVGSVVLGACGSGTAPGELFAGTSTATTAAPARGEVPASLEAFGDLPVARSEPRSIPVGADAASIDLGDGVVVQVPAGAFVEPTTLSAQVFDLDFARYADQPPTAVAYVLSTPADVALAAPVVLEVPVAADEARVLQATDGVWGPVEVPPGPTTRIEVRHFSDVATIVAPVEQPVPTPPRVPHDDEVPGDFLLACISALRPILGDDTEYDSEYDPDYDPENDAGRELARQLAFSFCTNALVERYSPRGVRVDVACVGREIGPDADLRDAIDACAKQAGGSTTTTEPGTNGSATPGPDAGGDRYVGTARPIPKVVDIMTVGESRVDVVVVDGVATITIDVTFTATWVDFHDGTEPCVSTDHAVLSGTGPAGPALAVPMAMTSYDTLEISGCEQSQDDDDDGTIEFTGALSATEVTGTVFLFDVTATRQ